MGTLSALLDVSRSALAADQAALNVTSNNVANQNTVGYTREVVTWQTGDSVTLSNGAQMPVSGPTVAATSKRDRVLEQRVQQQTQTSAETASQSDLYAQIESVFSITGSSSTAGSTAIGTAVDSFFSSLTALGTNPTDAATRAGVLSAATALAGAFNTADAQLGGIQNTIQGELTSSVAAVNALTGTIARLNAQIGANSPGSDAGTLEDQRQTAIAQLSQYVGLDQVTTEGNGLTLTTTGGTVLVAGAKSYALTATSTGGATAIEDASGTDVSASVTGGSVGGQLAVQGSALPAVRTALDAVAYRIASAVNAQNEAGVDGNGNAGAAIFALPATAAGAAGAIQVIASNASAIAAAATGEGVLGNTNANALASLQTETNGAGQTISGQYAALLGDVGTQASALSEQSTAQAASLTQLTAQRDSLSGVSLDDEAANLSQYQRAYEAAAKLFSVLDSIMTAAINLGDETTYS